MKKVLKICLVLLLLAGLGIFLLTRGYDYFMKKSYPLEFTQQVEQAAADNDLDPALIYSVIKTESGFDPEAGSRAGALGLMQITPDTFDWLQTKLKSDVDYTQEDLYTPEVNIRYGCKFLRILLDRYGERDTALAAYNAGMGNVNSWLDNQEYSQDGRNLSHIPFPETRSYVSQVGKNVDIYRNLYQFKLQEE